MIKRILKRILKKYSKLYNTYKPVSDVFNEPELHWRFSKWRHNHCLPVWRRGNRIKLFKLQFNLPLWLSFYKFSSSGVWKTKYDKYCWEFNPCITLVFFGWSISWWLLAPNRTHITDNDSYWEAILYYDDPARLSTIKRSIVQIGKKLGTWDSDECVFYGLTHKFLKDDAARLWRDYTSNHPIRKTLKKIK